MGTSFIKFLRNKSLSSLASILFLSGCQSGKTVDEIPLSDEGKIPSAPYEHLKASTFTSQADTPSVFFTKSLPETLSSIKQLQSYRTSPSYRMQLETLTADVFQKVALQGDLNTTIMTLFAASACHHPFSSILSQKLLHHPHPIVQLCAIQTLSGLNTKDSFAILIEALRSDYPFIRLEAAYQIAKKRTKDSFYHIDALSHKVPEELLVHMPELFALESSPASMKRLLQFLYSEDEELVIHTLLAIGKYHLHSFADRLLLMKPSSPAVLEALAFALQAVDREESFTYLHEMLQCSDPCVQTQATVSLLFLGDYSCQDHLKKLTSEGNLFAIDALSELPSIDFLTYPINECSKIHSLNKAIAMLRQKDASCLPQVKQLLSQKEETLLLPSFSTGFTRTYLDIEPLYLYEKEQRPFLQEQSLALKESLLVQALELHESAFIELATYLLDQQVIDLYPCLIELLVNKRSESAIQLLEKEQHRVGCPYNRAFATLALFSIGNQQEESRLAPILDFSRNVEEKSYRQPLPWASLSTFLEDSRKQQATTKARLYIETIEALAQSSSEQAIQTLIDELQKAPTPYVPFVCAALLQATM